MNLLVAWATHLQPLLPGVTLTEAQSLGERAEAEVVRLSGTLGGTARTWYVKQARTGLDRELLVYQAASALPDIPAPPGRPIEIDRDTWLLIEEAPGVRVCDAGPAAYPTAARALEQLHVGGPRLDGLPELLPQIRQLPLETAVLETIAAWPVGLVHGDAHAGNLFITPEGTVTLIDWSSAAIGFGLLDLAALVDVAERMGNPLPPTEQLLDVYWGALPQAWRSAYGDLNRAWAITRVVRALMELQWFASTGEDWGARVTREKALVERYLSQI